MNAYGHGRKTENTSPRTREGKVRSSRAAERRSFKKTARAAGKKASREVS